MFISTPENLKLPQDIYIYYPLTKQNYWYLWALEFYAILCLSFNAAAYLCFYIGVLFRLEFQFDILANKVKDHLEIQDSSNINNKFPDNKEIISKNDLVIHHQTLYE